MFSAPRRIMHPSPPQPIAEAASQDPNALQVSFIIAMPSPPEVSRRPVSPDEGEPLMHFEIGVADVKADREALS